MDKRYYFERNLLSLSGSNPDLCRRLTAAETGQGSYTFLESRSGELVPAITDNSGKAHPLHSLIDPAKEGARLLSTVEDTGFLVILGLGGAFHITAALARPDILQIVVVDFNIHGIAELLASKEYVAILKDQRVTLVIDPPDSWMEDFILKNYKPALFGGISMLPLRTRTDLDQDQFNKTADEVKAAIDHVSGDFSIQSLFGKRWFSNIIRNLKTAENQKSFIPTVHHAAVIAAGPSLDIQLPRLINERTSLFVIAADTSLPVLMAEGITPDAIVSIDCQHFSSYHFIGNNPGAVPLFLDMASPGIIPDQSDNPQFFTSGHPLSQYISQYWKRFPPVDTSGGNVSYAALSLADSLGAKVIDIYGADFSYPLGNTYARGTYIHKLFANKQNRLSPAEAQFSHFLFRNKSLHKVETGRTWYYQTRILEDYRIHFEKKISSLSSDVRQIQGTGVSLDIQKKQNSSGQGENTIFPFSTGIQSMTAGAFLEQYHDDIKKLPPPGDSSFFSAGAGNSSSRENHLIMTLMPLAASFKKEHPREDIHMIFERTKLFALEKTEKVLSLNI